MDGIKSDRKKNGADDLWGDPGVRKFGGSFRQISSNIMQSIYNFSYDFRSVTKHYIKLFGYGDEENTSNSSNNDNNEVYTAEEDPKVIISIEKVIRWNVEKAFGMRKKVVLK